MTPAGPIDPDIRATGAAVGARVTRDFAKSQGVSLFGLLPREPRRSSKGKRLRERPYPQATPERILSGSRERALSTPVAALEWSGEYDFVSPVNLTGATRNEGVPTVSGILSIRKPRFSSTDATLLDGDLGDDFTPTRDRVFPADPGVKGPLNRRNKLPAGARTRESPWITRQTPSTETPGMADQPGPSGLQAGPNFSKATDFLTQRLESARGGPDLRGVSRANATTPDTSYSDGEDNNLTLKPIPPPDKSSGATLAGHPVTTGEIIHTKTPATAENSAAIFSSHPANLGDDDISQRTGSPQGRPEAGRATWSRDHNTTRSRDFVNGDPPSANSSQQQRTADFNQRTVNSSSNGIVMAPSATVMEARVELERILVTIEDEILSTPLEDVYPPEVIQNSVKSGELERTKLTGATSVLKINDTVNFDDHYKEDVLRLKGRLGDYIREGHRHLHRRATAAAASRPPSPIGSQFGASEQGSGRSSQLRHRRVEKFSRPLLANSLLINDRLREVIDHNVTTDRETENLQDKLTMYVKESEEHIKELRNLASDAYGSQLDTEGVALENSIHNMKKIRSEAQTAMLDLRALRGMDSRGGHARQRLTDLKIPVYGGEMVAGKTDFYTFKSEMAAYFKAKCLTKEEEGEILKKSALTGAAKVLVYHLEDEREIWATLKESFGMTSVLVNNKIEEVKKQGACPTTNAERKREWVINTHSKLHRLKEVASEHGKMDAIHHSGVVGEVKSFLSYKMSEAFRKKVREKEIELERETTKPEFFDIFLEFLKDTVEEETFNMRFEMHCDGPEGKKVKPKEAASSATNPGRFIKKSYQTGPAQPALVNQPQQYVQQPPTGPPRGQNRNQNNRPRTGSQRTGNTRNNPAAQPPRSSGRYNNPELIFCRVCQEEHQYLYQCRNFQQKDIDGKMDLLSKLKVCHRCLRLDSRVNLTQRAKWWNDHEPNCFTEYSCDHDTCSGKGPWRAKHVVACREHLNDNKTKIDAFVKTIDPKYLAPNVTFYYLDPAVYTSNVNACNKDNFVAKEGETIVPESEAPPIYLCMSIPAKDGNTLLGFFDSGCNGGSMSDKAFKLLETENVRPGPTILNVAGGQTITLEGGDEQFTLELDEPGTHGLFTCIKMREVTARFPCWNLQEAWLDVTADYARQHPQGGPLPLVDDTVGGTSVDLMFGIRYNQHFPELIHMLPSGLAVYKAKIKSASGRQGVLGGCHASWENAVNRSMFMGPRNYFTSELRAYRATQRTLRFHGNLNLMEEDEEAVDLDYDALKFNMEKLSIITTIADPEAEEICAGSHCLRHYSPEDVLAPSEWDLGGHAYTVMQDEANFWGTEDTGTAAEYRCVVCRNCSRCKDSDNQEKISLKQEREQGILDTSVKYNEDKGRLEGSLPFVEDPVTALADNRRIAEKIFDSQMRTIEKKPEIRQDIIKSLDKLRSRGFIISESEVTEADKKRMNVIGGPGTLLPWSIVFKPTSKSSPTRMVFNGSSTTPSGKSLNNIVAKGENTLAKIFDILLRFRAKACAMSGDIRMAYNGIWLHPEYWKFQKFLWREGLDPNNPLVIMLIVTLIYGIKSSGQQTLAGFAALAEFSDKHFPEHHDGAEALKKDFYMDDLMKAVRNPEEAHQIADSIKFILSKGGLEVKSFVFSGEKPAEEVSNDGVHVGALGYLWDPIKDVLCLDIKPLYFGRPKRGVLPDLVQGEFREELAKTFTKRTILGKVAGVYDPLGFVTPISAKLKLDLHQITDLKVDWDDKIPVKFLDTWVENLILIQQLNAFTFPRAVVFKEAKDPGFDLIVSCDASEDRCIISIHARSEMKDGSFKCQLLTGKSKLVKGVTIPRAELKAAVVAAVLAHTTKRLVLEEFKSLTFVTDSAIVLYWIQQDYRPLQVAVRNAVLEIRRLTLPDQWYHLESANNVADTGTRVATLDDLKPGSEWMTGRPWMSLPRSSFPLKQAADITLNGKQLKDAAKEMKGQDIGGHHLEDLRDKVAQRYSFSKYPVDPCSLPWPRAIRTLCTVLRATKMFARKADVPLGPPVHEELEAAKNLFFERGTAEVKHFCKKSQYESISFERNKILYYNGRILISQEPLAMENTMLDVDPYTFCKPLLERYSPVSYSLMVWCHSSGAHHKNAVATLRESLDHAFIIGGRELAIQVRNTCIKCRRYKQKLVEVKMGGVHKTRLTVAPAFYYTQIDLMGPMEANCEHNHRSVVKIWGCIFKCPATGAVAVHVMARYNTEAFIKAYNRFASRYGHPNKIFIDEGSQLVKAAKDMEVSIVDITKDLEVKYQVGVEYETSPVGGHNWTGMVERSIKEVKRLFNNTFRGLKLDVIGYETAFAWVANELNNLPIGLGSRYRDLDHMDLLTPSRLLHGRNNRRGLGGCVLVKSADKAMVQLEDVYEAWWETWRTERMQDFIPQPSKWRQTSTLPKQGDIVIFPRTEPGALLGEMPWRIGRVQVAEAGSDDLTRAVIIEYRNPGETTMRTTRRAVRRVAVVHREEDLELVDCLNSAAKAVDTHFFRSLKPHI